MVFYVRKDVINQKERYYKQQGLSETQVKLKKLDIIFEFDEFNERFLQDVSRSQTDVPYQKHVISCLKRWLAPNDKRKLVDIYKGDDSRLLSQALLKRTDNNDICGM